MAIPFLGGGISTGDGITPLMTAGVDVPIKQNIMLTNRVNINFGDEETEVGVLVGVAYNFRLF